MITLGLEGKPLLFQKVEIDGSEVPNCWFFAFLKVFFRPENIYTGAISTFWNTYYTHKYPRLLTRKLLVQPPPPHEH